MSSNYFNKIDIIFIFWILFFFELKFILGYSSNIYFFFLFILVAYLFFYSLSKLISLFSNYNDMRQSTLTVHSILYYNKINKVFNANFFFFFVLLKRTWYNYKSILINNIHFLFNIMSFFFISLKYNLLWCY